jgi:RNA polymerase sigma-70 factor, ECF subfamily
VLAVVYLVLNQGYGGREDLAAEALLLGRSLAELLPDEPEVHGLLALMLVHDSRRDARMVDGELVLLAHQDRARWDEGQLDRGRVTLDRALLLAGRGPGPYVVQAAIAAAHARPQPDWMHIAVLYAELIGLTGSPVVELNRAVAVAEVEGPAAGLVLVEQLTAELDGYRYLHTTRAELLARLGHSGEAVAAYRRALTLDPDEPERRLYLRRIRELEGG